MISSWRLPAAGMAILFLAGLGVGALDGRPIRSPLGWEVALLDAGAGARAELRYRRDGRERTAELRIEELPSERADRVQVLRGVELVSLTPQIAAERGLRTDRGALIVEGGPAHRLRHRLQTGRCDHRHQSARGAGRERGGGALHLLFRDHGMGPRVDPSGRNDLHHDLRSPLSVAIASSVPDRTHPHRTSASIE